MSKKSKAIVSGIMVTIISMFLLCLLSPVIRQAEEFPVGAVIATGIYSAFMGIGTYCGFQLNKD